jgi:hypothetical protein
MITSDNIRMSTHGRVEYNAADKPGCERGTGSPGKRKPGLVYSVWQIVDGIAYCESHNVHTGHRYHERLPAVNLVPWSPGGYA